MRRCDVRWMQQRLRKWLMVPNQDPLQLQCQRLQATLQNLHDRVAALETQTTSPTAETVVPRSTVDDTTLSAMPDAHLGAQ